MKRFAADLSIVAEAAGFISAEDFRVLAEAMPQLIWTSDPSGNVDYISPHMSAFTGLDIDDPSYLDWQKLIHPDDLTSVVKAWSRSITTGETYVHDFRLKAADGTFQWFSNRAVPVMDKDGKVVKWYGATNNIDKIKMTELELIQASEEKDKFIATLGHELRNPLSAISNSYQTLAHERLTEEMKSRAMASLGRQIEHLSRLVEETLDISRLASGKFRILPTKVELNHLVESCANDMEHKCVENGIALTIETSDDPIWVKVDSIRLSQCVLNLLSNAIKFTRQGGNVTIGCGLDPITNLAQIKVVDDGVGMTPEEVARIFRPFSQGRTAGRLSREGLGLGLAITSDIIGLHGGDISVASEGKDKGSAFTLNLPVGRAPAESQDFSEHDSRLDGEKKQSLRVLVVDDDEGVSAALKMFLELEGHEVTVAHCGRTAFGALDRELPHVLFCDITLPGTIKGWDVAKRVVSNYPQAQAPYIIALSGHADPKDVQKCLEAGFDEHIAKPATPDLLREALRRASLSRVVL